MASPIQAPPTQRRRRSLAGPVVLIVVGIFLLLANMGVLHWYMLGTWFAHFWPVLIILWGVIKLIEYQQAQREGTRPAGIGAGGVFLLIVLIVCGLAATQASRFNWGELRDNMDWGDNDGPLWGNTYNYDDQLQQAFPAGASLNVSSIRGGVNVSSSDDNQIKVTVHKRISAESQGDADKWNAGTKPEITVSGNTVSLNANNQGAGDHWVATDMDITIPRKAAVVISNRRGDANVTGRDGDVDISNQHGDVSISDIKGKLSLSVEHSSVRVSQIAGDVSVEGRVNDVSVEDVAGSARLNGEFMESIKLARIAKTVVFKSSRTDLEFSKLEGDLDLDSGDLRANNVTGPVRLITRAKDIRMDGVTGDVRLEDSNGSVEVRMSKLGPMQVENRRGDIAIYLPDQAAFQVDARSRGGEIESDFGDLKIDNAHDQATASGTIGSGGPRLAISNEHGTIEIRKGSAMAEAPKPPTPPKPPKAPRAGSEPKVPEPTAN
jgi:putative adhesin/cell wall-active antibiotic response 4TMS protein YvqF